MYVSSKGRGGPVKSETILLDSFGFQGRKETTGKKLHPKIRRGKRRNQRGNGSLRQRREKEADEGLFFGKGERNASP